MNLPSFSIISACDLNFGIGINNKLPWNLPSELKYFQQITENSTVIMGRNTWDSLPPKSKPLSSRQNIVITTNLDLDLPKDVILASSIEDALSKSQMSKIFIIGGARLYADAIKHPLCKQVFLTQIEAKFECDTFFPGEFLLANFNLLESSILHSENNLNFRFNIYNCK